MEEFETLKAWAEWMEKHPNGFVEGYPLGRIAKDVINLLSLVETLQDEAADLMAEGQELSANYEDAVSSIETLRAENEGLRKALSEARSPTGREETREEIDAILGTDLCACGNCAVCQLRAYRRRDPK
jgi:hypothetical protein